MVCEEGHDTIVQLLPTNGADINLYKKTKATPLFIAFYSTAKLLVSKQISRADLLYVIKTDQVRS